MDRDYICRLVMRVQGDEDTPGEAATEFVRYLVEGGLITWIFRVEDPETADILGYFDGNGNEVDMDAILAEEDELLKQEALGKIGTDPNPTSIQTAPVETLTLPDPTTMATPLEITITSSATPNEDDASLLALAEELNDDNYTEHEEL